MKIKHFSGYGCVDAYKARETRFYDIYGYRCIQVMISVKGNHERGLELDDMCDKYELYSWLLKRFCKKYTLDMITDIRHLDFDSYQNGTNIENCFYTFDIKG